MKVLFAVSNEEISESIVKKYQKEYKQIISYKNVYYFNAILKELQKDKTYDRIVISEELEAFTHTQYDQIDKFIFEKMDSISDEACDVKGNDTPIIVICSDRRTKSEPMLVKLFGIGIYNAIIGNDRSVDEVCRLINRPRTKKEAKAYYKIDTDDVSYQSENENDVSEMEIQNIVAHYKRLGKNEERYIDSFNNIAAQYNDTQLRIITKFLPLNVRAVLEERSPKYQQIMSFNNTVSDSLRKNGENKETNGPSQVFLKSENRENVMAKPVVIPSAMNISGAKKMARQKQTYQPYEAPMEQQEVNEVESVTLKSEPNPMIEKTMNTQRVEQPVPMIEGLDDFEEFTPEVVKPKQENVVSANIVEPTKQEEIQLVNNPLEAIEETVESVTSEVVQPVKRGRGRPRKNPIPVVDPNKPKRGRGRPRKNPIPVAEVETKMEETILPGFQEMQTPQIEETILPGFSEVEDISSPTMKETEAYLPGFEEIPSVDTNSTVLPGFDEVEEKVEEPIKPNYEKRETTPLQGTNYQPVNSYVARTNRSEEEEYEEIDLRNLLTADKKIVTFVGTSKNGTSFIVNNVAQLLSSIGINVAILDTTQNRNSYYIYTKNEEPLREIATHSIEGLTRGIAKGINVNKNLTVYTSLPDGDNTINHVDKILETLLQSHSLILIDTDFNTPKRYFKQSQETYLIQSMDILTIQPLTAFLKELKSKNILDEQKLRIVLNKVVKIRGIKEATIIGGMAFYNDPAMSFMTELFDRDRIKFVSMPFEEETYIKYLQGIIECEISLKGYSKVFVQTLRELGNMIYPMVTTSSMPRNNKNYQPPSVRNNGGSGFSSSMNTTLDKMRGF